MTTAGSTASGALTAAALPSSRKLAIIPLPARHVRQWEGDVVVFDERSGETHVLTGLAADVFERLRRVPEDITALAGWVDAEHPELELDTHIALGNIVGELDRHQLLQRTLPSDSA